MRKPLVSSLLALVPVAAAAVFAVTVGSKSEAAPARVEMPQSVAGNTINGNNFDLEAKPKGDCKAKSTCELDIVLTAKGDYHINKEYPYKLEVEATGVELQGSGDKKNIFSKGAGHFTVDGEKTAKMVVKFTPAAAGNVTLNGTYKMSVCSEKNCQLETQKVSFTVAAK